MKITFILPGPSTHPSGGYKVVYEYANRLTIRGHSVTILHPFFIPSIELQSPQIISLSLLKKIVFYLRFLKNNSKIRPWSWFNLDYRIRMKITPNMRSFYVPNADILVATSWDTAEFVARCPSCKGKKYYFIQGLDTLWEGTNPERIWNTWKLPLQKIVVSRWLEEIGRNLGEHCIYIPDAIDFNEFYLDIPVESRDPFTVCIINSELEFKGTADGLQALRIVKKQIPSINGLMFGQTIRPKTLPDWVTYHQNPTILKIREIYNRSAVFIGTSWCEGFGLPGCEAAACGCALCLADNGGHREYAIQNKTALLHPPKHPDLLAENIITLLKNNHSRIELALNANTHLKMFSWDLSVNKMEQTFIMSIVNKK
jgi:glycosyltransferase involved in cell wall biosynthesis